MPWDISRLAQESGTRVRSNVRVRLSLLAWRSQDADPRPQPVLPPRIGIRMSGLRTSSFMPRVSEACNFAHMLAPMERDGVLETTVPAARLDAASTAGDASSWSLDSCEGEPEAAPRPMMHSTSDPLPFCGALTGGEDAKSGDTTQRRPAS